MKIGTRRITKHTETGYMTKISVLECVRGVAVRIHENPTILTMDNTSIPFTKQHSAIGYLVVDRNYHMIEQLLSAGITPDEEV